MDTRHMVTDDILGRYEPITLDEMSAVRLMNRVDTKFVTTRERLCQLLSLAQRDYRVQTVNGQRWQTYSTTYWDTDRFDMYLMHVRGHAGRQKLRFRTYVGSGLQFMEVKTKDNHGRTRKKRIRVTDMRLDDPEKKQFLVQYLHEDIMRLRPALSNEFRRITLVNRGMTERLTIDTALRFHNETTDIRRDMGDLVIVELKRDGLCPSPILGMLRMLRIKPHGFSKYCMGAALTNPQLPHNLVKPRLRYVEKMQAHPCPPKRGREGE